MIDGREFLITREYYVGFNRRIGSNRLMRLIGNG